MMFERATDLDAMIIHAQDHLKLCYDLKDIHLVHRSQVACHVILNFIVNDRLTRFFVSGLFL